MKLQAFLLLLLLPVAAAVAVAAFLLPEPAAAASLPTQGLLPGAGTVTLQVEERQEEK
uniref:Uncharacterized protein n=1 Tax=Oryza brachyantha TaxID=4533 RepID=J3N5T7_ORYBR